MGSFVPLSPAVGTSFGSCSAMTRDNVRELFHTLQVNPLFIMNLLGRVDYWAPQTEWHTDDDGNFLACDFFCQHPRWNLYFLGAPLSVYMRYNAALKLTTYIISHKNGDSSIRVLTEILGSAMKTAPMQINKIDDYLSDPETGDRHQLSDFIKQLQHAKETNAECHLNNADVSIVTATTIRTIHTRLHEAISCPSHVYERAANTISHVIGSMQKQKIWLLSYKSRQNSTLMLASILVGQQDAASNILLATSMKQDSTSMSAIAALTMVFLPGTFTAAVLDAGIFASSENSTHITVTGLWWLWLVLTLPLTLLVIASWWWYKKRKESKGLAPNFRTEDDNGIEHPPLNNMNILRTWIRRRRALGRLIRG
ncbi:uncharacterized protein P174DRAFT_516014 [Aspergillus novofumigatus IBT 16806]|uniref:Uncharacterized protein n=1 Tax=Aspergillus novofumigatus (strain IBT 16806) TaxID=1392255 RepID=A0A2I1BVF2_ASPN1|nr:uncharacterized protein P174DRAFT_516014 [Aspergillus novofumigatus IBT 16806]PKX89344.1 hypothetical protein P174DRAFT_516014 [Aspergillus novofumigatus IBT 16806]